MHSTAILRRGGPATVALLAALSGAAPASAQRVLWTDAAPATVARPAAKALSYYRTVDFQLDAVRNVLRAAPAEGTAARSSGPVISLPLPDGSSQRFRVVQVPVLAAALAARYPTIRTYAARGLDDPTATARLDVSPDGLHALIMGASGTVYIDPASRGATTHLVFERRAMNQALAPFVCTTLPGAADAIGLPAAPTGRRTALANGSTLRTYRLALACTGEYAAFHGGTQPSALAAMVTSVNRVSGIYERELAVRLTLVANNDQLIFLDPETDPYSNDDGGAMLEQNQTTVDRTIGTNNYDIGHVFSTGGGGVAFLASVCAAANKAGGVTGLRTPINDAFDVDYVAHEMGHQFGAEHTFNSQAGSCGGGNRAANSAYEPGSGSTIMAYAGICNADDIQPSSDPYFHSRSFDQIVAHITGRGNCAVATATGNTPPAVNAGRNYVIPANTPFVLTGTATDADNDALTYSWEQFNLGPAGAPNAPADNAPLFRVFAPTTSPSRTFPRLTDLLNNTQTIGERLPATGRRLVFRLVARDNRTGGGGVEYDSMNVVVVPTAGPFVVTAPNTATTWLAGAPQQVTWNVANTTQAPIGAATVDILLSTDNGQTYPTTLLANTPNDGCETVTVPVSVAASTRTRLRVQASGGIFFDISNQNFRLETPTGPTFFLQGPGCGTAGLSFCAGTSGAQTVAVGQLQGFSGAVALSTAALPAGFTVTYDNATVAAGAATTATISTTTAVAAGTYTLQLTGTSAGVTRVLDVLVEVRSTATQAATITSPAASPATTLRPRISWTAVPGATAYEVQLATDATFTAGVQTFTGIASTSFTVPGALLAGTAYFVRVRGLSPCATAPYSAPVAFTTGAEVCQTTAATSVPRTISAGAGASTSSTITITNGELVSAIRVRDVRLTHPAVSELEITLTNPAGRQAVLFSRLCPGTANLDLTFDEAATAALACPLAGGSTVRPATALSELLNAPANGIWTLTVTDNAAGNGGTLTGWSLELCTLGALPAAPAGLTTFAPVAAGNGSTITMLWLDRSNNESSFELERAVDGATFARLATLAANVTFYSDQVTANGTYCYRVRAVNPSGTSDYSNASCQTVGTTTSTGTLAQLSGLTAYPNPSTGVFQVVLDTDQRGPCTLRVTDALGRQVQYRTLPKDAAALRVPLDLSAFGAGVYMLHVELPGHAAVLRLLKQ